MYNLTSGILYFLLSGVLESFQKNLKIFHTFLSDDDIVLVQLQDLQQEVCPQQSAFSA